MPLQVTTLGHFHVGNGVGDNLRFPTAKTKALFAYLVLEPQLTQSREKLSDLLWSDVGEERARANLRQTLTRIRQALPISDKNLLITEQGIVSLSAGSIATDADDFERLIAEGTITSLERAAALYRGELLDGMLVSAEPFEDWLRTKRQAYRERAIACFQRLLEHYSSFGASTRGIEICNRLLELDPFREDIHRLLMNFYADQERRGAALAQFEECRRLLREELGVEPEAETLEIYQTLRDMSARTRFTRTPVLSRPRSLEFTGKRSSHVVTDLVRRSPWKGANWTKPSVAVIPFETHSESSIPAYLVDGIAEDLISNLARHRDLHVTARNSAFAYRGRDMPAAKIAEDLGVRYLVQGRVQQQGDGIELAIHLIDAATGFHVWTENRKAAHSQIPGQQKDLAQQIAGVLFGRMEQHHLDALEDREPESWEIYDCWLKGVSLLRKVNWGNVQAARAQFQRALELDPKYARGYVGLALAQLKVWSCLSWTSWWKLSEDALPYARKAYELDSSDHQVHSVLGSISLYVSDFNRARYHMEKAETINPNDARNLANSAISWALLGEPERAVRNGELAVRLDPFHPDWYMAALGFAYYGVRDYERAIAAMEVASDGQCDTRAYLAASYAQVGDFDAARVHAEEFIRHSCEQLGGDPETDFQSYIDGQVAGNPYLRADDRAHFLEGLRLAGLPASEN